MTAETQTASAWQPRGGSCHHPSGDIVQRLDDRWWVIVRDGHILTGASGYRERRFKSAESAMLAADRSRLWTAETQARPDTSALPWDVQVRLLVAEARGATWTYEPQAEAWWLWNDRNVIVEVGPNDAEWCAYILPNPLADPAAWGEIVREHLCGVHQSSPNGLWQGQWWREGTNPYNALLNIGPLCATIEEAVVAAFLASRGITPPPKEDA